MVLPFSWTPFSRPRPTNLRRLAGFGTLATLAALLAIRVLPAPGPASRADVQGAGGAPTASVSPGKLLLALEEAIAQVSRLEKQVDSGKVVPQFGEKARDIIAAAMSRAGPTAAVELEQVVEGLLEPLFWRQVALLRQQASEEVESSAGPGGQPPLDAVMRAERKFVAESDDLVPAATQKRWSLARERTSLHNSLERRVRLSAALSEERARSTKLQRATIEVIGKLQDQMELLAQKVQGIRGGGSPWVLSTSYRIPSTPLQLVGRYEQGRATVEVNLTPDKDPTHSEGGLAEGFGPANFGVSFNLGV